MPWLRRSGDAEQRLLPRPVIHDPGVERQAAGGELLGMAPIEDRLDDLGARKLSRRIRVK